MDAWYKQGLVGRIGTEAAVSAPGDPLFGLAFTVTGPAGSGKSVAISAAVHAVEGAVHAHYAAGLPLAPGRAAAAGATAATLAARGEADAAARAAAAAAAAAAAPGAPHTAPGAARSTARAAATASKFALSVEALAVIATRLPAPQLAAPTAMAATHLGRGAGTLYAVTGVLPQGWANAIPAVAPPRLASVQAAWAQVTGLIIDEAFPL